VGILSERGSNKGRGRKKGGEGKRRGKLLGGERAIGNRIHICGGGDSRMALKGALSKRVNIKNGKRRRKKN